MLTGGTQLRLNCEPLLRKVAQYCPSSSPQSPSTEDGKHNNSDSITEPLLHAMDSGGKASTSTATSLMNITTATTSTHNNAQTKYNNNNSSASSDYFKVISCDLKNATGDIPVQRQSHTAITANVPLVGQSMLIFGGYKGRRTVLLLLINLQSNRHIYTRICFWLFFFFFIF